MKGINSSIQFCWLKTLHIRLACSICFFSNFDKHQQQTDVEVVAISKVPQANFFMLRLEIFLLCSRFLSGITLQMVFQKWSKNKNYSTWFLLCEMRQFGDKEILNMNIDWSSRKEDVEVIKEYRKRSKILLILKKPKGRPQKKRVKSRTLSLFP